MAMTYNQVLTGLVNGIETKLSKAKLIDAVLETAPDDCVDFAGSLLNSGYGQISVKGKPKLAHRYALEKKLGREIREGYEASHLCDNKICINGNHLVEELHSENIQRRKMKGRAFNGKKIENLKFTADDVKFIRSLIRLGSSNKDIAKLYSTFPQNINHIRNGFTYNYI